MIFLSSLFLFAFQKDMVLTPVTQFELESPTFGATEIITDPEGNFYTVHFSDSKVHKFDRTGRLLQQIASPGKGPGEVIKPMTLFLMENNRKLIVIEGGGKWHAFDANTGKFIGYPNTYLPANRWAKWDDNHILGFFPAGDHFFVKIQSTGELVEKWAEKPRIVPGIIQTRIFATTVTPDKRIFYQEGIFPEVLIYTEGSNNHVVQKLKLPAHYREPPTKPFNFKRSGYNRKKLKQYTASFTQVGRFKILAENYLVVLWKIHEPYKYCFAIYDMVSWKPVVENFISPGITFHTSKDLIYVVEKMDTETDARLILHTYRFRSKKAGTFE